MDFLEILAILILAGAVIVLLYYYLQNNTDFMNKFGDYIPSSIQNTGEKEKFPGEGLNMSGNTRENASTSMGEKIKVKFKDIDMPNINTDVFSKKVDSFLNEKSDELIKDWELATKEDINTLEKRCEIACKNIDDLNKRFNEYREYTNERLDYVNQRLKKLEEDKE